MPKVTLTNEEVKILIGGLRSKRTRLAKKDGVFNNPELDKTLARIKFLENLK